MTQQDVDRMVAMYQEGASYRVIALKVEKSESAVKHWFRSHRESFGLKRRRDYKHKTNAVSQTAEAMCGWNLELSTFVLSRPWGRKLAEVGGSSDRGWRKSLKSLKGKG